MLRRTAFTLLAAASLTACFHKSGADGFKMISAAELTAERTAGSKVVVLDANEPDFRGKHGVIPDAILLTHFRDYDPKELPAEKDTPLVFYCANHL